MPDSVISHHPAPTAQDSRRAVAHDAVGRLGRHRSPRRQLQVRCRCDHHVADVYEVEGILVVLTTVHGTGEPAAGEDAARHRTYVDLLEGEEAGRPETLPASCSCGPHLLARSDLVTALEQGEGQLLVG